MSVRVSFPDLNEEQQKHIFNASKELGLAGVTFDSGYNVLENTIDWELDYSLKGAKIKVKK